MVLRLWLGFCCSLLWLGAGCGETSGGSGNEPSGGAGGVQTSTAGSAPGGSATAGGGDVSSGATGGNPIGGAPESDCQKIVFEDERVEQAVRAKLGLTESQPLDSTRMSQLGGTLYLEGVTSLAGLECATALGGLDLTGGHLSDALAIAGLPALKTLTFRQTELGPAALESVSHSPALRELYFYEVPVTDVSALARLPSLKVLLIDHGQVTDLEPLVSTKLESLHLDDNPLAELGPLATLTTLRTLSIARTKVTSVDALANVALQELDITGSQVSSLEALGGPFAPKECSHLKAEEVPLSEASWSKDRERLCALGWGVRASRPGDASPVTCGTWCDVR